MATHSRLSPSAAARWLTCVGSAVPQVIRHTTRAADEGTVNHAVLELALANVVSPESLDKNQWNLTGRYATVDDEGEVSWHDTRDEAGANYHRVAPYMLRYAAHAVRHVWSLNPSDLWLEQRVSPFAEFDDILGGVADIVVRDSRGSLHVIDFKAGRSYVHHVDNPQLLTYLLGALRAYGDAPAMHVGIVQPAHKPEVRTTCVSKRVLSAFRTRLLATAEHARGLFAEFDDIDADSGVILGHLHARGDIIGTVEGCKWCPFTSVCPAGPNDEIIRDFAK